MGCVPALLLKYLAGGAVSLQAKAQSNVLSNEGQADQAIGRVEQGADQNEG